MKQAAAKHVLASSVVFLIATLSPPTTGAQSAAVAPGDRIRVTTVVSTRMVGNLLKISPDSLVLATATHEMTIPRDLVQRLEVSTGQKPNTGKGAVIGFVMGGLAGGVWGRAAGAAEPECDAYELCFDFVGPGGGAVVGGLLGGLIGAGVGGLIGGSSHSDRWARVPLETSFGLLPAHPNAMKPVLALRIRVALP